MPEGSANIGYVTATGNIPNGKRRSVNRAGEIAVSSNAIFYTVRTLDGNTRQRFPHDLYSRRYFSALSLSFISRTLKISRELKVCIYRTIAETWCLKPYDFIILLNRIILLKTFRIKMMRINYNLFV